MARGDDAAASKLIPLVYDELRRLAGGYMRRERKDHPLGNGVILREMPLKRIVRNLF